MGLGGRESESAKGFDVNSVARGDIRPLSSSASRTGSGPARVSEGVSGGCEMCSLASISACRRCNSCCSRRLGEEILPLNLLPCGVVKLLLDEDASGLLAERSERVRVGCSSSEGRMKPIPSCASRLLRSKGDEANEVDVGDIRPKESAGSASGVGFSGVRANSDAAGVAVGEVGVAASSDSGCGGAETVMVRGLEVDVGGGVSSMLLLMCSGSTTFRTGIT